MPKLVGAAMPWFFTVLATATVLPGVTKAGVAVAAVTSKSGPTSSRVALAATLLASPASVMAPASSALTTTKNAPGGPAGIVNVLVCVLEAPTASAGMFTVPSCATAEASVVSVER